MEFLNKRIFVFQFFQVLFFLQRQTHAFVLIEMATYFMFFQLLFSFMNSKRTYSGLSKHNSLVFWYYSYFFFVIARCTYSILSKDNGHRILIFSYSFFLRTQNAHIRSYHNINVPCFDISVTFFFLMNTKCTYLVLSKDNDHGI